MAQSLRKNSASNWYFLPMLCYTINNWFKCGIASMHFLRAAIIATKDSIYNFLFNFFPIYILVPEKVRQLYPPFQVDANWFLIENGRKMCGQSLAELSRTEVNRIYSTTYISWYMEMVWQIKGKRSFAPRGSPLHSCYFIRKGQNPAKYERNQLDSFKLLPLFKKSRNAWLGSSVSCRCLLDVPRQQRARLVSSAMGPGRANSA